MNFAYPIAPKEYLPTSENRKLRSNGLSDLNLIRHHLPMR